MSDPFELSNVPPFLEKLKQISAESLINGPPDELELMKTIKKLKNGKASNDVPVAFVKHAIESREFRHELTELYKTIWETHVIPDDWGHSKLVTLWKGLERKS